MTSATPASANKPDATSRRHLPLAWYSRSLMEPPFWIVFIGKRWLAEVWLEKDAEMIAAALNVRRNA